MGDLGSAIAPRQHEKAAEIEKFYYQHQNYGAMFFFRRIKLQANLRQVIII